MNGYQIFEKYWDGLVITAGNPHLLAHDAVRLALRLAIHEAAGAQNDTALVAAQNEAAMLRQRLATAQAEADTLRLNAQPLAQIDQRQAESDRQQIAQLNEWLAQNAPAQYWSPGNTAEAVLAVLALLERQISELQQGIAAMDADNAGLLAKLTAAEQGWAAAQADADQLALQVAQQPIVIHTNGVDASPVDPTPAAQSAPDWGRSHPAWQGIESIIDIHLVAGGGKKWRQLSKELRRQLVEQALRYLAHGGTLTMAEFDSRSPSWMPSAATLIQTLECKWSDLLKSASASN